MNFTWNVTELMHKSLKHGWCQVSCSFCLFVCSVCVLLWLTNHESAYFGEYGIPAPILYDIKKSFYWYSVYCLLGPSCRLRLKVYKRVKRFCKPQTFFSTSHMLMHSAICLYHMIRTLYPCTSPAPMHEMKQSLYKKSFEFRIHRSFPDISQHVR
jgi:hypothetical protein